MPKRPKGERRRAPLSVQWRYFAGQTVPGTTQSVRPVTGAVAAIFPGAEAEKEGARRPYRMIGVALSGRTFPVWVQQNGRDLTPGDRITGTPVVQELTGRTVPHTPKAYIQEAPILANVRYVEPQ